jgi:predicted transcriptional regulator
MTLKEVVDKYVLVGGHRCFVVTRGEETIGLLTLSEIKKVPHSSWPTTNVAQTMVPSEKIISTQPEEEAWAVMERMGREGITQLPVVERGRVVGMFCREDLIHYLSVLQSLRA